MARAPRNCALVSMVRLQCTHPTGAAGSLGFGRFIDHAAAEASVWGFFQFHGSFFQRSGHTRKMRGCKTR
jgi:hypothetical protein